MSNAGDLLDEIATVVFGGDGGERLQPLLSRFDDEVGRILDDDVHRETLLAARLDWALCDAPAAPGASPADTWLRRAMRGEVDNLAPRPQWAAALGTYVGLFEVWPARRPFLRDRIRGLCVALADPIHVEPPPDGDGPAALWEVRLVIDEDGAHMCRPPLPYPREILRWLEDLQIDRFGPGGKPASLMRMRRRWLQFSRALRADPMSIFRL